MPKRSLSPKIRKSFVDFLIQRDGTQCRRCGSSIDDSRKCRGHAIELDHINGDRSDYAAENLQLLCKSCNSSKGTSTSSPPSDRTVQGAIHTCVQTCISDERSRIKHEFHFEHGTPQMQMNQFAEPIFRDWLAGYMAEHGSITKKEAIRSGSAVSGASSASIPRYLDPLIAEVGGIYDEVHEGYHKSILIPRRAEKAT